MKKNLLSKIEKDLNEIQKGCRTRIYSIEDIKKAIEFSEKELEKLPKWMYKYISYSCYETLPNNYRNSADSTYICITFTTTGKVKNIEVERYGSPKQPFSGEVNIFSLDKKCFIEYFEQDINDKLLRFLYKQFGFNVNGKMEL